MKCDKFQAIAGQLARNEIMDAHDRDKALAHASVCKLCEEELTAQNQLSDSLRFLAKETKDARPEARLEERVLMAFRERTLEVSRSASGRRRYWAAAAAAVVLMAVGIAAWRWHAASVPRQTQQASAKETSPFSDPNNGVLTPTSANQTPSPKSYVAVTPRRVIPRRHLKPQTDQPKVARKSEESSVPAITPETQEVVTHFVSLGYGSALDLQDGAQMVRVELPRSALARFGLPMNIDRADERIKADVLVGTDGLARAIRFVQPADQATSDLKSGNERNE